MKKGMINMLAPIFKNGITGFDSMIWTIKRYKKARLSDYVNFVKSKIQDWEKALEFVNYDITENNIFKDKLNPFLPEEIRIQYRRKKKYDKSYGITDDDFYILEKFLKYYTYHKVNTEEYNGYKKVVFKLYTKEEVKQINSETYKRFFLIKKEEEEKRLRKIEEEKRYREHKEWIRWQTELFFKD